MLSPFLFLITLLAQPNIIIRISPAKSCISRKCKWPVIFQEIKLMGRMDATLFVHPAELMDCNSKKRSN